METKQKRKKVKVIVSIILPVLLIMGILAVSGHAEKPESPPGQSKKEPPEEPIRVSVSGAIEGLGNPYEISVKFMDLSFGYEPGQVVVANPDYPPALKVTGPGIHKRLSYYYCDFGHDPEDGICTIPDHDPENYKCLIISGGQKVKKTEDLVVIFPEGSTWRIQSKKTNSTISEGVLDKALTYEVLAWGTP